MSVATDRSRRRNLWVVPAACLLVTLALGGTAVPRLSPTIDEAAYVHHGTAFWFTGDTSWLVESGVQPLPILLQNLPGAVFLKLRYGGLPDGAAGPSGALGLNFGRTSMKVDDQIRLLNLARFMNLLACASATVGAVWWLARRWFDDLTASLACVLCACEPNLLAAEALATVDALVVPIVLGLAGLYWEALGGRPSSGRRFAQAAGLFGLGVAMRLTVIPQGLVTLAAAALTRAAVDLRDGRVGASGAARGLLKVAAWDAPRFGLAALVVSWAAHGFLFAPLFPASSEGAIARRVLRTAGWDERESARILERWKQVRVPVTVATTLRQAGHASHGHEVWFAGKTVRKTPAWYYPYVLAMKVHVVVLAAAALGIVRRASWRVPLGMSALLMWLLSGTVRIGFGPRYFLAEVAWLGLLGGVGLARLLRTAVLPAAVRAAAGAGLAAALFGLTAASWPEFLTHTGLLWGGDSRGYRHADANYDWGQGLYEAFRAADRVGLRPVAYVPTCDPAFAVPRDREVLAPGLPDELLARVGGRYLAVSVHELYHAPKDISPAGPFLRALGRMDGSRRLSRTFVVFDLRGADSLRALERLVKDEIDRDAGRAAR